MLIMKGAKTKIEIKEGGKMKLSDSLMKEREFDKAYAEGRAKGLTHRQAIEYARAIIVIMERDRRKLEELFNKRR